MAKKKEAPPKTPSPEDEFIWYKETEKPAEGSVYGGLISLPDGRPAKVYMVMGKEDIETLEVHIVSLLEKTNGELEPAMTVIFFNEEELNVSVEMGDRKISLKRYIFEELMPYYYEKRKK